MRFASLAVSTGVLLAGCFPVAAHPTRVESGLRLGAVLGLALVSDSGEEGSLVVGAPLPTFDLEIETGIRDTSRANGPGLRLSALAGMSGIGFTAYGELPRSWLGGLDAGIGFASHRGALRLRMPYLQFGQRLGNDLSWFSRQAVAFASHDSVSMGGLWIPTVGVSRARRGGDASLYLSAVIGGGQRWVERPCLMCTPAYTKTLVMIGASLSTALHVPGYTRTPPRE